MCIKAENYVTIQGWMITDLKLKGTDLFVFSVIYSFCQDEYSTYRGGINYLREWCQASKPTIINSLKKLVELEYLNKIENLLPNNTKAFEYSVNHEKVSNIVGGKEILPPSKETLPNNNISILITNIINNFNILLGKNFLPTGKNFRTIVHARLDEGYAEEDFYMITKLKKQQWEGNSEMERFLKPDTLFASKHFDNYRNEAIELGIDGKLSSADETDSHECVKKSRFDGWDESIVNQMRSQGAILDDDGIDYSLLTEAQIEYIGTME